MSQSFITLISGGAKKLITAITSSAGAADDGKIVALDSTGRLDQSFMPVGIGADTSTVEASEAVSAGDLVNIWNDAGTPKVRKADAATNKPAMGFVLAGFAIAENALVYHEGPNTQLSSLTPGAVLYLSDSTPGGVTATGPISGSGKINQQVGIASTATVMAFEPGDAIELS